MSKATKKTDDNAGELRKWRASHFAELEATLIVLRSIRDDPEASNKDRVEASKSLGRLLAVMSPDKVTALASDEKDSASVSRRNIPTLPPALRAKLDSVLNNAPK